MRTYDDVGLNVLGCQWTYSGQVVINAEARFNTSLRPRKPEGSLGRTAQDGHLDSHTAPEHSSALHPQAWTYIFPCPSRPPNIVQELCESRGGRPELSVLTSLLVSVDVKNY